MPSPGADPEQLLIRQTTLSLVLMALLERLLLAGTINHHDLADIRQYALNLAEDFKAFPATGPQVAGDRLARGITRFFQVFDTAASERKA